jgi:predicted dehydrogenase (TIGR03970 family)
MTTLDTEDIDVIVVGAGAAGSPLAARLSEDPDRRVLLLEAGADYASEEQFPPEILDSRTSSVAADDRHPANWAFEAELSDEVGYRVPRGRVVGGSTSLNATYFLRATPAEFARWVEWGNDEWSYEAVLPFYKKAETDLDLGATEVHGGSGPMRVRRDSPLHPVTQAFLSACAELGYPDEMDKNAGLAPGYGLIAFNNVATIRQNTALAYLAPVRASRPNLQIRGGAFVRRVVVDGTTAIGVEVDLDGRRQVIRARETVLSAGAVKSPHLLMLSGIGPATELERVGIPVLIDLPGVGAEFSDHPILQFRFRCTAAGVSDLGSLELQAALSFAAPGSDAVADLEIFCVTKGQPGSPDILTFGSSLTQEASRGRISLRSPAPEVAPRIEYNYLSHPSDILRIRELLRTGRRLLESTSFRPYFAGFVEPKAHVLDDDVRLDAWIASNLLTCIHMSASCRMGPDDERLAVVDQYGRVRGVTGLRVADTSIAPYVPTRGTSSTTVMIGERVADFMRTGR